MGGNKTITPQQKETTKTALSPSKTAAPPIVIAPDPLVGNAATQQLLGGTRGLGSLSSGYVPDPSLRAAEQEQSLKQLYPRPNLAEGERYVATVLSAPGAEPAGQLHRSLQTNVVVSGQRGALEERESFDFSIAPPAPLTVHAYGELGPLPDEDRITYPVNLTFTRALSYADGKGRIVRVEVGIALGMETETWSTQASLIGAPSWDRMRDIHADAATAMLTIDGTGYVAWALKDMPGASFNDLLASLAAEGGGTPALPIADLANPSNGAGDQFNALQHWLDAVDADRIAEAERQRQEEEQEREARNAKRPWYERAVLAMAGAVYAFANMFIEAGKQLWDMGRLAVAAFGKDTHLFDYQPKMTSEIGKAAEEGQGTLQILGGMAKGMVEAPKRAWQAAERGDWFAFGEQAFNSYMAGRTAEGLARGGFRAVSRGIENIRGVPVEPLTVPEAPAAQNVSGPAPAAPSGPPPAPTPAPAPAPAPDIVEGQARPGEIGRHASHGARGADLISEHVTPGEFWRQLLGDAYNDAHYDQDTTLVWERTAADQKTNVGLNRDSTAIRDLQQRVGRGEPVNVMDEVLGRIDKSLQSGQTAGSQVAPGQIVEAGFGQLSEKFDMAPGLEPGARIRAARNAIRWRTELEDPNTSPRRQAELRRKLETKARNRKAELQATGTRAQGGVADFEAFDWERTFSADPNGPSPAPIEYPFGPPRPASPTTATPPAPDVPIPATEAPPPEAAPRPSDAPASSAPAAAATVDPATAPRPIPADPVAAAKQRGGVYRVLAGLSVIGPYIAHQLAAGAKPQPANVSGGVRVVQTVADMIVVAHEGRIVGAYLDNGAPFNLAQVPDRPYWVVFQNDTDRTIVLVSSALLSAGQSGAGKIPIIP